MDDLQLVLIVIAVVAVCLLLISVGVWLCRKCKIGGIFGGQQRVRVKGGVDKADSVTVIDQAARIIRIDNDDINGLPEDLRTMTVHSYKPPTASQNADNNPDTNPYAKKNLLNFLREYHSVPEDDPAAEAKKKLIIYRTMLSWDSEKPLPKTYALPMNSNETKGSNERLRYDNIKNFAVALKSFIETYDPSMYKNITKSLGNASSNIAYMITTNDVKKYGGKLTNDITQLINSRNVKPVEQVVEETTDANNSINNLAKQNEQLQAEINTLKDQLAKKDLQDTEIDQLRAEIAKLQQDLLDAQNKSKALADVVSQLESTKTELETVKLTYTNADVGYNRKIEELNKKISDITNELTVAEAAKLGELQSQIQSLKQNLSTSTEAHFKDKDLMNKQIADANEQINLLTAQRNKLTEDVSKAAEIENALSAKTAELAAKLTASTSEVEGLTADKERLIQSIKAAEDKRNANEVEIARLTSLLEANSIVLKEALKNLKSDIDAINVDAKKYGSELASLEQRINTKIENDINSLKLALEPRFKLLEKDISDLKDHTDISPDSISKALQRNKEKAANLKNDINERTETISDLIAKNNAKSEELDVLLGGLIEKNKEITKTVESVKSVLSTTAMVTATPERPEGVISPPKTIIGKMTDIISTALGNSPNINDFATSVVDEAKATSDLLMRLAEEVSSIKTEQAILKDSLSKKLDSSVFDSEVSKLNAKNQELADQLSSFEKRFTELDTTRTEIGKGLEEKIKAIDGVNASQDAKIAELESRFRTYEDTESVPIVYRPKN